MSLRHLAMPKSLPLCHTGAGTFPNQIGRRPVLFNTCLSQLPGSEIILSQSGMHILICTELHLSLPMPGKSLRPVDLVGFEKDHAFILAVSVL